jgi:hypothetical protein
MEHKESFSLATEKMKKNFCLFKLFRTFYDKITWFERYFFSVCHAPLPLLLLDEICVTPTASPLKLESWHFGSQSLLRQLDALHTQNFEIQVPKGSHLREIFKVLLFKPLGSILVAWKWPNDVQD